MQQTHIGENKRENFADFEELFKGVESFMGYLPNAHLTMAEKPELLIAFSNLANTIFQAGGIDLQTKQLIALATSLSWTCTEARCTAPGGGRRVGCRWEVRGKS